MMMDFMQKDVGAAVDQTVQEPPKKTEANADLGLLWWMGAMNSRIPPWWSKRRDAELRKSVMLNDHILGAFYTLQSKASGVTVSVEPRDKSVSEHQADAAEFTRILVEESQFGAGWVECFSRFLWDLYTQDNGAFFEIIGPGRKDGPLTGAAQGIAHVDSHRCTRTGSAEFPVVYTAESGKSYKLHYTRVAFMSQCPSPIEEMKGVGICWLSRCLNTAQNLADIGEYESEKLGSRPLRAILLGRGIPPGIVTNALMLASSAMDSQGYSRFSPTPVIEGIDTDATLELVNLASLPDGFDKNTATTLGMYTIAMCGGVPARWLWPATSTGATRADALFQHYTGASGGLGQILHSVATMLGGGEQGLLHVGGKFLPPHLRLVFDFQDDVIDQIRADIENTRAQARQVNLASSVTSIRVERQKMLTSSELTEDQFIELELADGRLKDGSSVLTLFASPDPRYVELLDLGIDNPLSTAQNDASIAIVAIDEKLLDANTALYTAPNAILKAVARECMAALQELRNKYERLVTGEPEEPTAAVMDENIVDDLPSLPETQLGSMRRGVDSEDLRAPSPTDAKEADLDTKAGGRDSYATGIRSAVRGLWSGVFDYDQFFGSMMSTIRAGLTRAWYDGAREMGILPSELTPEERLELERAIQSEFSHLNGFASDIESNSKANGGKIAPLLKRADLWINRWLDVKNQARLMAGGDKKLKWVLGATEEHCKTCAAMNGKIKRASYWRDHGPHPQQPVNDTIECKGWKCLCTWEPTDEPQSKGPLPKWP